VAHIDHTQPLPPVQSGPREHGRQAARTERSRTAVGKCDAHTSRPRPRRRRRRRCLKASKGRLSNTVLLLSHYVATPPLNNCHRLLPRVRLAFDHLVLIPMVTILGRSGKNSPGRKLRRNTKTRIKKTVVCAGQTGWPGAGSNRRPSDFQDSGAVSVSDRHRPRPASERPRDRWRTPANERE
jgi:hypothetical protein